MIIEIMKYVLEYARTHDLIKTDDGRNTRVAHILRVLRDAYILPFSHISRRHGDNSQSMC